MANRLDPPPPVDWEAEEEEEWRLVTERTKKVLERYVTERLERWRAKDGPFLRVCAETVKEEEEEALPRVKCVGRDQFRGAETVEEEEALPRVKCVGRDQFREGEEDGG